MAMRVQPGASRTGIDGLKTLDDGQVVLAVRVSAAPEDGKANAALVKLLAKTWKLPKRTVAIVTGHGARRKVVHIDGDPGALQECLRTWLAGIAKTE